MSHRNTWRGSRGTTSVSVRRIVKTVDVLRVCDRLGERKARNEPPSKLVAEQARFSVISGRTSLRRRAALCLVCDTVLSAPSISPEMALATLSRLQPHLLRQGRGDLVGVELFARRGQSVSAISLNLGLPVSGCVITGMPRDAFIRFL